MNHRIKKGLYCSLAALSLVAVATEAGQVAASAQMPVQTVQAATNRTPLGYFKAKDGWYRQINFPNAYQYASLTLEARNDQGKVLYEQEVAWPVIRSNDASIRLTGYLPDEDNVDFDLAPGQPFTLNKAFGDIYGAVTQPEINIVIIEHTGKKIDETLPEKPQTVYVNYVPGYSVAVWNDAFDPKKPTGKTLKHATAWHYVYTATIDGHVWYNLGGDQWIDGNYATLTPPATDTALNRVGQVHYTPGFGINVRKSPAGQSIPGKKLQHGTKWKVLASRTVKGVIWYNLGGNQWVDGTYLKLI